MMVLEPAKIDVPLRTEEDGSVRVGNSRVLLEIVIGAFLRGKTPEAIVESYPSLQLQDVYSVIAYFMQNRREVDAYMDRVSRESEKIRAKIEAEQDIFALRERLRRQLDAR